MIGVLSFIACLVAWFLTTAMVYEFEKNNKQHNRNTWCLFIAAMVIFAVVSYL